MSRARLAVLVLGTAALASQAGHLVTYELRFGAAAQQVQSSGVHAYWPAVVKTGLGLGGLVLLSSLLLIGAARLASGRRMVAGSAPPFVPMLAAMYTIQLLCFTVQETAEALAGGGRATPLVDLLLLGALGQLPVALVTALAVRWLLARVRPAIATLRVTPVSTSIPTVFAITSWPLATESVVRVEVFDRSDVRGPPSF